MQSIKWGIIGCGDVTELKSGPAFNKVPDSALVAVMRRDAKKAASYASRHNVPTWYSDANLLINDPDVNAIYIATPPSTHHFFAMAAINAGKPVYLEKPMALNATEAAEIAAFAKDRNILLSVAHYRREQPKFIKIKKLLDGGLIGDIRFCTLQFLRPSLSTEALQVEKTSWRVNPDVSGGGLFHDLAPHQLDLMLYFFGDFIEASGFSLNQAGKYPADDIVSANIIFKSSVVFNGLWSFAAAPGMDADTCEIIGTKGKISFSVFDSQTFNLTLGNKTEILSFEPLIHVQLPMIQKVVSYFLNKAPNPCSGADAVKVMQMIDAVTSEKSSKN